MTTTPVLLPLLGGAITLQQQAPGEDTQRRRFEMVVNTGKVMRGHPFLGNFALDLEGFEVRQAKIAVLLQHDATQRVGFALKNSFKIEDRGLVAEGELLKTSEHARALLADSSDGFPFQASPGVLPLVVEEVEAGASVEVNGHELQGPGTVFRRWQVQELSFVALGADDDTTATTFGAQILATLMEKRTMADTPKPATPATTPPATAAAPPPASPAPAPAAAAAPPAGQVELAAERQRVSAILAAAAPDQQALARQYIDAGTPALDAVTALNRDLQERRRAALALGGGDPPVGTPAPAPTPAKPAATTPATFEERCKSDWDANAGLREEFNGDFAAWKAYAAATAGGRVKLSAPDLMEV